MGTAQDMLKRLLDERIAPLFKRHGYKRERHRWGRRTSDGWLVFQVQSSKYSDSQSLSFTANLGVHSRAAALLLDMEFDEKKIPGLGVPYHTDRIGSVMPLGQDYWWKLDADANPFSLTRLIGLKRSDPEAASRFFTATAEDCALPHLEALGSDARLLDYLEGGRGGWIHWARLSALVLAVRGAAAFEEHCARYVANARTRLEYERNDRIVRMVRERARLLQAHG